MPIIYLKHAKHGAKVAISVLEADLDKRNGWVEFDVNAPVEEKPSLTEAKTPIINALPTRRGRGRPQPQGD
jgi:hypothetical protein